MAKTERNKKSLFDETESTIEKLIGQVLGSEISASFPWFCTSGFPTSRDIKSGWSLNKTKTLTFPQRLAYFITCKSNSPQRIVDFSQPVSSEGKYQDITIRAYIPEERDNILRFAEAYEELASQKAKIVEEF